MMPPGHRLTCLKTKVKSWNWILFCNVSDALLPRNTTPTHIFWLGIVDYPFMMIIPPLPSINTFSCLCRWLFGEITCQLYAMCGVLFGLCSLTNLTALSLVCCLKVCFPNHGERIKRNNQDENDHNNFHGIFFHFPSHQVASSLHHTRASWWLECGVMRLCLLWGPWRGGDVTVLNLMAWHVALTGRHPTMSFWHCPTSSAFSSSATHCHAPSSSSPTRSFCWQCRGHVRRSSSTCHHRLRRPMRMRSLSRWGTLRESLYCHWLQVFHDNVKIGYNIENDYIDVFWNTLLLICLASLHCNYLYFVISTGVKVLEYCYKCWFSLCPTVTSSNSLSFPL